MTKGPQTQSPTPKIEADEDVLSLVRPTIEVRSPMDLFTVNVSPLATSKYLVSYFLEVHVGHDVGVPPAEQQMNVALTDDGALVSGTNHSIIAFGDSGLLFRTYAMQHIITLAAGAHVVSLRAHETFYGTGWVNVGLVQPSGNISLQSGMTILGLGPV